MPSSPGFRRPSPPTSTGSPPGAASWRPYWAMRAPTPLPSPPSTGIGSKDDNEGSGIRDQGSVTSLYNTELTPDPWQPKEYTHLYRKRNPHPRRPGDHLPAGG